MAVRLITVIGQCLPHVQHVFGYTFILSVRSNGLPGLPLTMTSEYEHSIASPVLTDGLQEHASRRHGRHTSDIERETRHLRELLQLERQRADDAEERIRETLLHLKTINEARIKAVQEASQATEELRYVRGGLHRNCLMIVL